MPLESLFYCTNVHYLSQGKGLVKSFQTQELNCYFFLKKEEKFKIYNDKG